MKIRTITVGILAFAVSSLANAQLIVTGSGDAFQCYLSAENGDAGKSSSIRVCKKALSQGVLVGKDRASTHVNLGILLMRRGDHTQALEAFDKAIELSPALSEAYINRGACLIYLDRPNDAITSLTTSIDLGTQYTPDALYNRALAYEQIDDFKAAYDDLQRARTLRPEWAVPLKTLERYQVVTN